MSESTTTRAELWLVRHGQTEWSVTGRHTGRSDIALNEQGLQAAGALKQRLSAVTFERAWTSPLRRAAQTCSLAGFGDRAELLDDLREWDYGSDEGLTTAEIRTERPGWTVWSAGPRGGESAEQVGERADRVIARVHSGSGRAIAFAHGHLSRILAARWIGKPARDGALLRLDTAAICVLGWERETAVIRLWNDSGGLPG